MNNSQTEEMHTNFDINYFQQRLNHYDDMIQLFESDEYRNYFENNSQYIDEIIKLCNKAIPGRQPNQKSNPKTKPKPKRTFSEAMGYDNDYHV